jgi:hypothetical protein
LVKARSAARAITAFMRYLLAKKRHNIIRKRLVTSALHYDLMGNIIDEGTDLDSTDVLSCERDMLVALAEFKTLGSDLFAKNVNE